MSVGLVTAFLGGALAILSPCAALLLPAFFASRVGAGSRLALHGLVFYLGLVAVLVPLGAGVGALGGLFAQHRAVVIAVASGLMIVLGLAQAWGWGFDPARLVPGAARARHSATAATTLARTFVLGAVSAVAGFCAGPILGAVLTMAAARGDAVGAGVMLAAYGAGMVVPLIAIAGAWQRLGERGRRRLRGRSFTALDRTWHTTSLVTGAVLVVAGALLWWTNGLLGVPEVLSIEAQARAQEALGALANPVVDVVAIVVIAAAAAGAWWWATRPGAPARDADDPARMP